MRSSGHNSAGVACAVLLGVVVSCGVGGGADQFSTAPGNFASKAGLQIVSGGSGSDTIQATLATPLVVEARDSSGHPMPGVTVNFGGIDTSPGSSAPNVWVGTDTGPVDRSGITTTTDGTGRASARVAFSTFAGTGRVRAYAPLYGWADTAHFVILPGSAGRLQIVAGDTALNPDGVANIVVHTVAFGQNVREDPYTLTTTARAGRPNAAPVDRSPIVHRWGLTAAR